MMGSPVEAFLRNTSLITYDNEEYHRAQFKEVKEIILNSGSAGVQWLNTYGLGYKTQFKAIVRQNTLDDFLIKLFNDEEHPNKFVELEELLFVGIRVLKTDKLVLDSEQMLFVVSHDFVWSMQERHGDYFQWIRERIAEHKGLVRSKKADYLFFLILESIVDNYHDTFHAYTEASEQSMKLSDVKPTPEFTAMIEARRKNLFNFKKATLSLRDIIIKIESISQKGIKKKYFVELKEQANNLLGDIDFELQELDSKMNLIFSIQGHRLNEVMKTLTIFSVIFIPLTFMAGIYGMNFTNMPELETQYGYFILLGLMVVVVLVTLFFIRRKGWF